MVESTSKLNKRELPDLLEKDVEFRYAVAGLLGIPEILRRLEKLEESLVRLWEEVRALRESVQAFGGNEGCARSA